MTASMLGYLMAINAMCGEGMSVRSVDIADRLSVARASVCKALDRLSENGLAVRDYDNRIRLTARGRETVAEYLPACDYVCRLIAERLGISGDRARREALAAVGALSADAVAKIKALAEGKGRS